MKPSDIKKAVESLQQFLLDEYGLDTKAFSNKATEQPSPTELNAIFGQELIIDNYDNSRKTAN
jgi:hypothetical protein